MITLHVYKMPLTGDWIAESTHKGKPWITSYKMRIEAVAGLLRFADAMGIPKVIEVEDEYQSRSEQA